MPTSKDYMDAHQEWLQSYVDRGFEVTFLSIMFNPLQGSEQTKKLLMEQAICDCYRKAVKAMFRRPRSIDTRDFPFWIACSDWPILKIGHKINRDHLANIAINDGLHPHSVCCTPPNTRIKEPFELHLHENQLRYAPQGGPINRIHASTVAEQNVARTIRYALKSIERRRVGVGDVLILPKCHSEFSRLGKNETPRDAVMESLFSAALRKI